MAALVFYLFMKNILIGFFKSYMLTTNRNLWEASTLIFIETERLHRPKTIPCDAAVLFAPRPNELSPRYQRGQTKDYEGIAKLVERRKNDVLSVEAPFMVAVAIKETNEMIGEIVVMPKDNTISLGYTFSYKYHRQGYAFESLVVLIDILHKMVPDWEFISFTEPQNVASMGLLLKLDYKNLGYVPSMESQAFGKWTKASTEEEIAKLSR